MSDILDEFLDDDSKRSKSTVFYLKLSGLALLVLLFGIYIGDILFGKSSLEVLLNLQENNDRLKDEVVRLKKENAALQKDYFELKQLDPDN